MLSLGHRSARISTKSYSSRESWWLKVPGCSKWYCHMDVSKREFTKEPQSFLAQVTKGGRDSDDVWSKMSGPQLDVTSRFQPNKSKRGPCSGASTKQNLGTGGPTSTDRKTTLSIHDSPSSLMTKDRRFGNGGCNGWSPN